MTVGLSMAFYVRSNYCSLFSYRINDLIQEPVLPDHIVLAKTLKEDEGLLRVGFSVSRSGTELESTESESGMKVVGYDDKGPLGPCFIVTSPMEHVLKISDTFAEI